MEKRDTWDEMEVNSCLSKCGHEARIKSMKPFQSLLYEENMVQCDQYSM